MPALRYYRYYDSVERVVEITNGKPYRASNERSAWKRSLKSGLRFSLSYSSTLLSISSIFPLLATRMRSPLFRWIMFYRRLVVRLMRNWFTPERKVLGLAASRTASRENSHNVTHKRISNWRLSGCVTPACLLYYVDQPSRRLMALLTIMLMGQRHITITVR